MLKNQVVKAVGIGVGGMMVDVAATSGWMHRGMHNKRLQYPKPIEHAARVILWGNGIKPRYWREVHKRHHLYSDQPGDPHSPWVQSENGTKNGMWRNLKRNHLNYRDEVRDIMSLPPEQQPHTDEMDRAVYDKIKAGLSVKFMAHVAVNKVVGNHPAMAAVSFAVEMIGYVGAGNFVNTIGHGGVHPWKALLTGNIEPHEDDTRGADSLAVGLATLGEGMQKWHHDHEEDLVFASPDLPPHERTLRDPMGMGMKKMVDAGILWYEPVDRPQPDPMRQDKPIAV